MWNLRQHSIKRPCLQGCLLLNHKYHNETDKPPKKNALPTIELVDRTCSFLTNTNSITTLWYDRAKKYDLPKEDSLGETLKEKWDIQCIILGVEKG